MANIGLKWQDAWKERLKYFNSEIEKSQKRLKKKQISDHLWNPFKKEKKAKETEVGKLFGKMEVAYATFEAAKKKQPDKAEAALNEFEKAILRAGKAGGAYVGKMFASLTNKATASNMTKPHLAEMKKEITALSEILQSDVETIVTNAHAKLVYDRKMLKTSALPEMVGAIVTLRDAKVRKTALLSTTKKALTKLKKLERDPTFETFKRGIHDPCREMKAQVDPLASFLDSNSDKRAVAAVQKTLTHYGQHRYKLKKGDQGAPVLKELAALRASIIEAGKLGQKIKV